MKRTLAVIAGVALLWAGPLQADYTDEGSFLGALGANPYYLNDFNDLTTSGPLGLARNYAGNGFSYTITTTGAPGLWAVFPGGQWGGDFDV
jgi:hypothetical protein